MSVIKKPKKKSSEENLDGLTKEELILRVKQLIAHNNQLKNVISKKMHCESSSKEKVKKGRNFDFSKKPQYCLASEIPFNLFATEFDSYLNWVYDRDCICGIIRSLQKEWSILSVKSTMVREMINELEVMGDIEGSELTDCLLQGIKSCTYVPLLQRNTCGKVAARDPALGSWFIQSLATELLAHGFDRSLLDILSLVIRSVAIDCEYQYGVNILKQQLVIISTLSRILKFVPK